MWVGQVWVWCETSYEVASFDEVMNQLTRYKWEFLLEWWCDVFLVSDILINRFIGDCGRGGWAK